MQIDEAQFDGSFAALVRGASGLFRGESATLRIGQSVVLGRSRSCGLSVARSAECLRLGQEALERHPSYRRISRRHLRISLVSRAVLEIEDLSTNGTVVDGYRVDKRWIEDFDGRTDGIVISFGEGETVEVKPLVGAAADERARESTSRTGA